MTFSAAKERQMQELVSAIKAFQDSVDRFDTAAAAALGVNSTDLRCLTLLHDHGALQPARIADMLGLTRSAMTTALHRVELAGYVKRSAHEEDGRSAVMRLTSSGTQRLTALWKNMRASGRAMMEGYSSGQLATLVGFFQQSIALQTSCTERLKAVSEPLVRTTPLSESGESRRTLSRRSMVTGSLSHA